MNKVILIISALIGFSSFGQETIIENDTIILWSKTRNLTWEDFKSKIKSSEKQNGIYTGAVTASGPVFIYRTDKNGIDVPYPLTYFFKSKSWTISNDSLLLFHEQLHFDIAEVYTRKLRKMYNQLIETESYESSKFSELSEKISNECAERQKEFDNNPAYNREKQLEWRMIIDKELEQLAEFEYTPLQ